MCFALSSAEEVKSLKARVERLEGGGNTISSAHTSRQTAPSSVNILDPLDSVQYDRSAVTRTENTIQLGSDPMQPDPATLHRTVKQLVQSELQSESIRGTRTFIFIYYIFDRYS